MKKLLLVLLFLVTSAQAQWFTDTVGGSTAATNLYDIINFNPSGRNITASSTDFIFNQEVETTNHFTFAEISTPTPEANKGKLYTKTDNKIFFQDGAGVEHEITGNTGTSADYVRALNNLGLDDSVAASALTINLVLKNGSSTPSGGDTVDIAFRNSTIANGGYVVRSVAAALSIVVPSGATLGTIDAVENNIFVYAIDNAGTVELAVSLTPFLNEKILYSTTIMGVSSDSSLVLYSTTARSNVPLRFLGTLTNTQTNAGTWASVSDSIQTGFKIKPPTCYITDEKAANSEGGTFTSGSFQTRTLQTLRGDCSFVNLASDAFALSGFGRYDLYALAPGYKVDSHRSLLRNTSDSTDTIIGSTEVTSSAENSTTISTIIGSFTLTAEKTFEIQHRCQTTRATNGFGQRSAPSGFSIVEIYTQVKITKVE